MNPGQILVYVVLVVGGVGFMVFKNKCLTALCFMNYFCLMGSMVAVYAFIESLFDSILQKRMIEASTLGTTRQRREQTPGQVEMPIMRFPETTMLSRFNAKILENPWIFQFIERDYYGMGQSKEMEPMAMLIRMEKFGVIGMILMVGVTLWFGLRFNPGLMVLGFVLGFATPHIQARRAIAERQKRALMNLPSFVDLLALTIESGLDYLNSMEKILLTTFKNRGPLEEEIENVLRQVQLGYPRRDGLRNMARRVDVQEIRSLVGLLVQSDELGTGLVQLLRNFSQDMRNRRTGKAEEMAGKASTKMLGPMMIFIFPVIFALILGPFAVSLVKGGGMSF